MTSQSRFTPSGDAAGLRISGVSHAYGSFVAVRGIDLTVHPGKVHCLLGPSGSGKSTLLRLVAGLEVLQEGEIAIAGRPVAGPGLHVKPEQRAIGFVFQDYALFPHLNAWRNVAFGMPKGPADRRRAAAEELLAQVGLEASTEAMPHTLSGGQQQRVALARALARRPRIMLLDEPFSGLDTRLREDIRRSTLEVLRAAGVATLMVTHDPREALEAGDQVSVLQDGRRVQTGSPDEIYGRSASREIAEIFGPVNVLEGVVADGRVETPWGVFEAPGLTDGQTAEVLIRPEAVELTELGSSPDPTPPTDRIATVVEVVPEGGLRRIVVERAGPGARLRLTSHTLASRPRNPGTRVAVAITERTVWTVPRG